MSGSVMLGGFAKNWRISRVGYAYAIQLGKMLQPERQFENDGEVPYLKSQHVQAGVIFSEDLPLMWANLAETSKYGVRDGDLLVCEGGDVGRAAMAVQVPEDTIIQNALHRVRSSGGNSLSYLLYVLLHVKNHGWFDIICNKSTIAHLTREKLSALAIPLPPPLVQQSIAAHLDRETAKIDTLIAKKRELIAKLKEQRSALISRTVTRGLPPEAAQATGLDPNPPMKNSGVAWLGEVPAHWTVKPVKFLTQIVRGQFTHRPRNDPSLYDGAYPFVQTGDIARAKRYVTEYSQTLNDLGLAVSKQFPEGTLVMTIAANIGDMAVINFPACFPDSIVGFIPTARVDIDFLYYLFLAMKRELLATATLNTQLNLNVERIAAIDAVQPPVNEQRKIADYLDKACGEIDSLLLKVETAITRLTEYRAALITAAVTGQLDIAPAK